MGWHYPELLIFKDSGIKRWYLKLNGLSFGELAKAELAIGSTVTGEFLLTEAQESGAAFFDSEDATNQTSLQVNADGTFNVIGGTATLDGAPIMSGVTVVPIDSTRHTYIFTATVAGNIKWFGRNYAGTAFIVGYPISFGATDVQNTVVYGSGTLTLPLNESYSDTHIARESDNADGVDVWLSGGVSTFGESVLLGGSDYHIYSSAGVVSGINSSNSLEVGSRYLITGEIYDYVSGDLFVGDALGVIGEGGVLITGQDGAFSAIITSGLTSGQIKRNTGVTDFKVRNLKYQQTTDMLTFNTLQEDYVQELP